MKIYKFLLIIFALKQVNLSVSNCYVLFNNDFCKECDEGYKLTEDGQCIRCESGKIEYKNYCFTSIPNCESYGLYAEGERCRYCKEGYILNEDYTQCTKCAEGQTSYGDVCIKKIEHCESYYSDDEKNYKCSYCESGFTKYQDGLKCIEECGSDKIKPFNKCIDIIDGCKIYKEDGTCEKCENGYKLNSGNCESCPSYASDGKECFNKIANCALQEESNKCTLCYSGYKLSDDQTSCSACGSSQTSSGKTCYDLISNCISYDPKDYSTCKSCNNNYYLSNNGKKCEACGSNKVSEGYSTVCFDKIENCEYQYGEDYCGQCSSGYHLTSSYNQCNNCGTNQYYLNGKCIAEILYCSKYSSDTECSQCKEDYKISDGKCLPCPPFYSSTDGKTCYLWHFGCEEQDASGKCVSCEEGLKLSKKGTCSKNGSYYYFVSEMNLLVLLLFILF